jgi:hypothetical protein
LRHDCNLDRRQEELEAVRHREVEPVDYVTCSTVRKQREQNRIDRRDRAVADIEGRLREKQKPEGIIGKRKVLRESMFQIVSKND